MTIRTYDYYVRTLVQRMLFRGVFSHDTGYDSLRETECPASGRSVRCMEPTHNETQILL